MTDSGSDGGSRSRAEAIGGDGGGHSCTDAASLLFDEDFLALWTTMSNRYVSREEFGTLTMPAGSDAGTVWEVIQTLRSRAGRIVGSSKDPVLWFNLPLHEQHVIWQILEASSASSNLFTYLQSHSYELTDVEDQVDEAIACLAHDGMPMKYEAARMAFTGQRRPHNDVQTVIGNYRQVLCDEFAHAIAPKRNPSDRIARQLPDAPDIPQLTELLVRGTGLHVRVEDRDIVRELDQDLAAARSVDASQIVTLSAHITEEAVSYRPFSSLNALVGSLVRKVFFIRANRPVLSLLPLTAQMLGNRTGYGLVNPRAPEGEWGELWSPDHTRFDLTPYFVLYLERTLACLDSLGGLIDEDLGREKDIRDLVRDNHRLNHRQRDVLLRSLDDPNTSFDYGTHQEDYQVVYTTARADLMGLANEGYLQTEVLSTRNLRFRPARDLEGLIEEQMG